MVITLYSTETNYITPEANHSAIKQNKYQKERNNTIFTTTNNNNNFYDVGVDSSTNPNFLNPYSYMIEIQLTCLAVQCKNWAEYACK